MKLTSTFYGFLFFVLLSLPTHAESIVFRMGESDPGAIAGEFTSFTRSECGTYQFTKINANPMRSEMTPPSAGSALAIDFLGSHSGMVLQSPLLAEPVADFTIDGWYYIRHTGTRWLFQFGRYGVDGFGLYTTAGNIWGIYQGVTRRPIAWDTGIPIPSNQWAQIRLVRENGIFRIWVNGIEGTSREAVDLVAPSAVVTISARPVFNSPASAREDFESPMDGIVDEWRIFPNRALLPD